MSYTPTTWSTGDTITASALNKIENGIANGGSGALICNSSNNDGYWVLDKTVQEIYNALLNGTPAYIKFQYGTISEYTGTLYLAPIIKVYNYDDTALIRIVASKPHFSYSIGGKTSTFSPAILIYSASGVNEYPVFYTSIYTTSTSIDADGIG